MWTEQSNEVFLFIRCDRFGLWRDEHIWLSCSGLGENSFNLEWEKRSLDSQHSLQLHLQFQDDLHLRKNENGGSDGISVLMVSICHNCWCWFWQGWSAWNESGLFSCSLNKPWALSSKMEGVHQCFWVARPTAVVKRLPFLVTVGWNHPICQWERWCHLFPGTWWNSEVTGKSSAVPKLVQN